MSGALGAVKGSRAHLQGGSCQWQMWGGGLRGSYVVVAVPVLWWHRDMSPHFVLKS